MPAMNELSYGWALMAFDIDCAPPKSEDEGRRRHIEMVQLARLFMQELEMHFTHYSMASCVVARNDVHRYRLMFPGVAYIGSDSVVLLTRLVKRKVYGTSLAAYFEDGVFDLGPVFRMALRVHGTSKSPGGLSRKYRVSAVLPDSQGRFAPIDRLSVRPSAEQYQTLFETPERAYLQACTPFARAGFAGNNGVVRPHEHRWKISVLHLMFGSPEDQQPPPTPRRFSDSEPDESSSSFGDDFGQPDEEGEERYEGYSVHLISRRLIVGEHGGVKCVLLLHGDRGDTATMHYSNGTSATVSGVSEHQYKDDEEPDELLDGPLISLFTPFLYPPRVDSLLHFPVELFVYGRGLSPFEVAFNEATEKKPAHYSFGYRPSEARRTTVSLQTSRMAEWALTATGKTAHFNVVNETVYRRCEEPTQYCNDVFSDTLRRRNEDSLLVVELKAGCGSGKTVFSLEYIGRLLRANPSWCLLCVTPRAQLCSQLAVKVRSVTGLDTHLYTDGAWPESVRACVVTLDSLVRTAAPVSVTRSPTVLLLDEVELSAHHLATSSTMSNSVDGRNRTLETLLIMMARARRIVSMDAHFGFRSSLFLSMLVVKRAEMGCFNDESVRFLHLEFERMEKVQFCVLSDEARRVAKIREDLANGKRVIVFEPTPRKAEALASIFSETKTLVVQGRSDMDMKSEFASNPVDYLRKADIALLIHTTSVGVGVSIDERYFDTSYVTYRSFLEDAAIVQGMYRARQLELCNGVRQININYDSRIRRRGARLLSIQTVGDAVEAFERAVVTNKELFNRYSALTSVSGFDARVQVDRTDIKVLFVASMLAAAELAVDIQGYVCDTRLFDEANECVIEGRAGDSVALTELKLAEADVELVQPLSELDGPRTQAHKRRLLDEIGYEFDAGARSQAFMGRLELGMSKPANLRRFAALLVYLQCSQYELRRHVIDVLSRQTETMPLFQLNDKRGITIGIEALVAAGAVKALGMDHLSLHMPEPRNEVDFEVRCESVGGSETSFGELFEWVKTSPAFRTERYKPCKRSKSIETRARQFLNCFFGGTVCGIRSGISWDYRQIALSAELVPGFLRASQLECPPEVLGYCSQFNGTWDRFLEAESQGTAQSAIY